MDANFVGRKRELAALEREWKEERGAFVPIYGRRRVGKSELILHFLHGKRGLYYVGKRVPPALQVREFLRAASEALGEPLLAEHPADGWSQALRLVEERWKGAGKFILAFDEFQWVAEASPELPSILQEAWDRRWKNGGCMLILCGSYIGFMEREVLGQRSPLFGRRTAQIFLRPFGFAEAARFHPGYSRLDQARVAFICGGVPLYLRCFSRDRSVEQNIAAALFEETGPLVREAEFLLREELREVANYHSVLLALAAGSATPSAISKVTGLDQRALQFYLSTLREIGYVQRRHPLTETMPSVRVVRYALEDPLLCFWFRFVFPNLGRIAVLGSERAVQQLVQPQFEAFSGHAFERLCRDALPSLYVREGVAAAFEIGEYWDHETQIDLVGLRKDNWTDLGECKWTTVRSPKALRIELMQRAARFPNKRSATLGLRYFTRTAVKPPPDPALHERWHCLEELYSVADAP
jgi:hypothetical protein